MPGTSYKYLVSSFQVYIMKKGVFILLLIFSLQTNPLSAKGADELRAADKDGMNKLQLWSVTPDDAKESGTGTIDIDVSDIKQELQWLRDELKTIQDEKIRQKEDYRYSGNIELMTKMRQGNGENNYRVTFLYDRDLGNKANISIKLDTMDAGFYSMTSREVALSLIEAEGNLVGDLGIDNPVWIKATFGPGDVIHRDTMGIIPSDDYRVYRKLFPSFTFGMDIGGTDVSASYIARSIKNTGEVSTSEVDVNLSGSLGEVPLAGEVQWLGQMKCVFIDVLEIPLYDYDYFQGLGLRFKQSENIYEEIFFDNGSSASDNGYFNCKVVLKEINEGDTDLILDYYTIASSYRKPFIKDIFMPLNVFDKYVLTDTVDIGMEIIHRFSNRFILNIKSDLVLDSGWNNDETSPGTSFTNELSLSYYILKELMLTGSYRVYNVPSETGQFGNIVPKVSDFFSLSLNYIF